eukprot:5269890-Pyramimonas_sp.AAC.1
MAKGKSLHACLDRALGRPHTSGKQAAHRAWRAGLMDKRQHSAARRLLEGADRAKHETDGVVEQ